MQKLLGEEAYGVKESRFFTEFLPVGFAHVRKGGVTHYFLRIRHRESV